MDPLTVDLWGNRVWKHMDVILNSTLKLILKKLSSVEFD